MKAGELRRQPEWSEVTSDLTFINAPAGERTEIWGNIDGELDPVGGVCWHLRVRREKSDWLVERDMTLNANDVPDRSQIVVTALPPGTFAGSGELVGALPSLVAELLDLPDPREA